LKWIMYGVNAADSANLKSNMCRQLPNSAGGRTLMLVLPQLAQLLESRAKPMFRSATMAAAAATGAVAGAGDGGGDSQAAADA
jgi:hypothetical protein